MADIRAAARPTPTSTRRWPEPGPATSRTVTSHGDGTGHGGHRDRGPGQAEGDDREHGGRAGADADADDVGAGERVAQRGLEDRAADAEGDPDQHPEHRPRQLGLHQDVRRPGDLGAEQDPEEVRHGVGEVAEQHPRGERPSRSTASPRHHQPGPAARARRGARRSGRRRRSAPERPSPVGARVETGGRHQIAPPSGRGGPARGRTAPRRQRAHDPDLDLGRRQDDPADRVGQDDQDGAAPQGERQHPAVVGTRPAARTTCGTTRPTKAIGPASAVAAPASRTQASPMSEAVPDHVEPEPPGDVVPEGEGVEQPGADQGDEGADEQERRTGQEDVEAAAADGADLPVAEGLHRLPVREQHPGRPARQRRGRGRPRR